MPGIHHNEGESQLDRMERQLVALAKGHEWFNKEHKRLLAAQVALTERLDRLFARVDGLPQPPLEESS